jgi:predicted RND superfamily exporter protein
MERIAHFIVHHARLLLFFIILLTAFFAYHARQIRIDSSLESILPPSDPEKQYYDEIRQLFGSDDVAVIAVIADTIYTPQTLQKIQRLTEAFKQIPEVKNVLSVTNAKDIVADVLGETPNLLIPEIPATGEEAAKLKEKFANEPLYLKLLVSEDGRAAAINVSFLSSITDEEFLNRGIDDKIQEIVAREDTGPEKLYYTGLPHFKAAAAKAQRQDLEELLPIAFIMLLVVLALCLRSVRGVVLPALAVLMTLVWTLGIMVLAGSRLSLGTVALPPMLLVLSVAYSLHVVSEYYELARPGRTVNEVVLETLRSINMPVLMAALTTVLGFLSLFVNQIVSIREMGVYSAAGIVIAFLLAIVFVPACLMLLRLPARDHDTYAPGLSAALRKLTDWVIGHRRAVMATSVVIALLCLIPIPSIHVGSNFLSFFRKSHPTSVATDAVNQFLGGSMAFYVVIDSNKPDIMKQGDTLRRIKELQNFIASQPGVDKTLSFADYCEAIDKGLQALPPEDGEAAPPQPQEKGSLWDDQARLNDVLQMVFLNSSGVSGFVNHPTYSRSNILVRTSLTLPSDIAALIAKITAFAPEVLLPELTAHPTGNLILNTRTARNLITGQVQSLSLSIGVIFIIMSTMFLSFRVGVVAMIPNIFPILFFFGLMGISGAVLSLSTNMIASIVLGLAVDDTIHVMSRLSSTIRTTADQKEALLQSLCTVGKPTLYYSLLVFLGFLSFSLSTFVPIQQFGLLSAATVLAGVVAEMILMPALLATTPVVTLWDVLYIKLGKDPHKTIPLFDGLRPFQAKIVTLMGELRAFPRGQHIVRQGEMGNEMYVLISGTADVVQNASDHQRLLNQLERGAVFGEMGLLRHHERTADVIATKDVEVLAVNERFLSRIKRRYPRIASEIFFNISRTLSDRLEQSQRPQ